MLKKTFKISISCPVGDPLKESTWSKTPLNIIEILRNQNYLGHIINTTLNYRIKFLIKSLSNQKNEDFLSFTNIILKNYPHIFLSLKNITQRNKNILHMGILDVPIIFDNSINHFAFVDYTWSQWFQNSQVLLDSNPALISKKVEALEKQRLKSLNHIFTTSNYVKEYIKNYYSISEEKITTVGTGTGIIKPFNKMKNYLNKEILFVAKNRFEDKGGDLLLKTFTEINKIDDTIKFILVGQENYKEKFKNIRNVEVYGFIYPAELQELFNKATLFIMLAKNEPWGLVYLESLLTKTPIIGLNKNSFPELSGSGKYGLIIDGENPKQIAINIVELINDPHKLNDMGENGQNFILENYRWETVVNKIISIIQAYN